MSEAESNKSGKKVIQIDCASDTICPWSCVGKKNMDKAMNSLKDQFDFEVRWHPHIINVNAPKKGIDKKAYYEQKFGLQAHQNFARMAAVFRELPMEYDTEGLTGCSMDSHRLIYLAGQQGYDKQHKVVDEIFNGYFAEGKFIGDRKFLLECASKAGVEGAAEFLDDPKKGFDEVNQEFEEYKEKGITAVPSYWINGKTKLSGGQPPHIFVRAFKTVAKDIP